jgi:hypothetical protein
MSTPSMVRLWINQVGCVQKRHARGRRPPSFYTCLSHLSVFFQRVLSACVLRNTAFSDAVNKLSEAAAQPSGGGGEIRTHETFRPSGFQDRRDQPLCHPSGRNTVRQECAIPANQSKRQTAVAALYERRSAMVGGHTSPLQQDWTRHVDMFM